MAPRGALAALEELDKISNSKVRVKLFSADFELLSEHSLESMAMGWE
jgi:hypothetical protein